MKNAVSILLLAIFAITLNGCSLFSSDKDEAETATVADGGEATEDFAGIDADTGDGGEFADDSFESGDLDAAREEIKSVEELDFDAEAMAKGDAEPSTQDDLFAEDVVVEDNNFGGADPYVDDDYGQSAASTAAVAESDFSEDYLGGDGFSSEGDALFVDEGSSDIPAAPLATNQEEDLFGQDMEPVVDTPSFADNSAPLYSQPVVDTPSLSYVPVKKMKPAAYQRSGGNLNRLYVVRPGDNMNGIAEKLYGDTSKADQLYSYNSHFKGKTLKVGDKVYYESPNSPNDSAMKTYYEDVGMEPQYYTSQEGDNIRKVAETLLGHSRSWMEVWATNMNVESKWRLPAGLQLRYWPDQPGAAPVIAANSADNVAMPEPEAVVEEPAVEEVVQAEEPQQDMGAEQPDAAIAMNDAAEIPDEMPPPQEVEEVSLDDAEQMAALDDPGAFDEPEEMADPAAMGSVSQPKMPPAPPTPGQARFQKPEPPGISSAMDDPIAAMGDDSVTMAALGGLLILAAIIMLIFIRRNRAKRVNFSQTQV